MMLYGLFAFENYRRIGTSGQCGTVIKKNTGREKREKEKREKRERATRGGSKVLALITSNREMRREIS